MGTLLLRNLTLPVLFSGFWFCNGAGSALSPDGTKKEAGGERVDQVVQLGRMLFFEPRLSGSNMLSCASCHNPALGWTDRRKLGLGHEMRPLSRNTPTILNAARFTTQFWDGRVESLEEQAKGPMSSPLEMNQDLSLMVTELVQIGYRPYFEKAFPGAPLTIETAVQAIAAFERTVVSRNTAFDRWKSGDNTALSDSAARGYELFTKKAKCVACHAEPDFTDNGFHNIGVLSQDPGRYTVTPIKINLGAFKTPQLRDVAKTAPYMHNGMYATLEEVIEHYDRGGDSPLNLDPNMEPLGFSRQEKRDLVDFLLSLSGDDFAITIPALP